MKLLKFSLVVAVLGFAVLGQTSRPVAAGKAELLFDKYGVAHIFAADRESKIGRASCRERV